MKLPYCKQIARARREDGSYLLIVALTFFSLMAVLGLAVDTGNVQRTRLKAQRAADAASIAASYLLEDKTADQVIDAARKITYDNLKQAGIHVDEDHNVPEVAVALITPEHASAPRMVNVSVRLSAPSLLLGQIPGFQDQTDLSVQATAGDRRVAVALVLDVSGSMSATHPVPCDAEHHPVAPLTVCTKLQYLKTAAKNFINLFKTRDRMAIVSFSDLAHVNYEMRKNFDKTLISDTIDGLGAAGYTNTYDAIRVGREQLNSEVNSDLISSDLKSLVLVTDGAPMGISGQPNAVPVVPPVPNNPPPLTKCLMYPDAPPASQAETIYAQRRYVGAIVEADAAREEGVKVYAIGLGTRGEEWTGCSGTKYPQNDPYQCPTADKIVKNYLLARLTFDKTALFGDLSATPPRLPHPDFPIECVPNKDHIIGTPGKSYITEEARNLNPLLQAIGKNIRARLTQ